MIGIFFVSFLRSQHRDHITRIRRRRRWVDDQRIRRPLGNSLQPSGACSSRFDDESLSFQSLPIQVREQLIVIEDENSFGSHGTWRRRKR